MNLAVSDLLRSVRRLGAVLFLSAALSSAPAATYYVNFTTGSDAPGNPGTSVNAPWKTLQRVNQGPAGLVAGKPSAYLPGDRILLARGSTWPSSYLAPRGSGSAGNPITVDAYGPGTTPPLIQVAGAQIAHEGRLLDRSAGVWLFNQQHWEIRNLEITNYVSGSPATLESVDLVDTTVDGFRWGMLVEAQHAHAVGTPILLPSGDTVYELSHIRLEKNRIHHIEGYDDASTDAEWQRLDRKSTGGIHVRVIGDHSQTPAADTTVRDGTYQSDNYATVNPLELKETSAVGFKRHAYLKFDIRGVVAGDTTAKLRLYGRNAEDAAAITVNVTGVEANWLEPDLTWLAVPAPLGTVGQFTVTGQAGYHEVDVTAYVRARQALGETLVAFRLTGGAKRVEFRSREDPDGEVRPRLNVTTAATRFNDIVIAQNHLDYVNSTGISTRSGWTPVDLDDDRFRWRGFVVRDNTVLRSAKDGMVIRNTLGALVERNVIGLSNQRSKWNGVGVFTFFAKGTVFQYNEIYGTNAFPKPNGELRDGQGIDIDYQQRGTVFQYNYSHENEGGFMVSTGDGAYGYTSVDSVVRYNISINDDTRIFRFSGGSKNIHIHNNTIVTGGTLPLKIVSIGSWGSPTDPVRYPVDNRIANNIILNRNPSASYDFGPTTGAAGDQRIGGFVLDSNIFHSTAGTPATEPPEGVDPALRFTVTRKFASDPKLVGPLLPGSGWASAGAFKLAADSPAIGAGSLLTTPNATLIALPARDYWGHPLDPQAPPNIGAYDGQGMRPASTLTFQPEADAGLRDGNYAGTEYGSSGTLDAEAGSSGNNRMSLLRFNLSQLDVGSIGSAKLRIHGRNVTDTGAVTLRVHEAGDTWIEADVNWNNRPTHGAVLSSVIVDHLAGYRELDVTAVAQAARSVGGDNILTLMLTVAESGKRLTFSSLQAAANRPQLVVAGTMSRVPSADTYVRGGTPNADFNYGSTTNLEIKDAETPEFTRHAYLRFTLPAGLIGANRATLRLHGAAQAALGKMTVFRLPTDTWIESGNSGITWNNAPATGFPGNGVPLCDVPVTASQITATVQDHSFDLTDLVQDALAAGASQLSFVLKALDNSSQTLSFGSRESAQPPRLVLD